MSLPLHFLRPSLRLLRRPPPLQPTTAARARLTIIGKSTPAAFHNNVRLYTNGAPPPPPSDNDGGEGGVKGPNVDNAPHVTEETNQVREIMGEEPVDIEETGTPIKEIIEREGTEESAPEVLKEEIRRERRGGLGASSLSEAAEDAWEQEVVQSQEPIAHQSTPPTETTPSSSTGSSNAWASSSWSTTESVDAVGGEGENTIIPSLKSLEEARLAREASRTTTVAEPTPLREFDEHGKKLHHFTSSATGITYDPFVIPPPIRPPIPQTPIPAKHHLKHRYSPFLEQVIPLFQLHGKKAQAQRVVQDIIKILRTKPVPKQGAYLLVPSTPALTQLPSDPVAYFQAAVDSVAPLVKLKTTAGSGGSKVTIPFPIAVRRRRRTAVQWMMEAADSRRKTMGLAERFADECVKVVEGKSSAWEKRNTVHRMAVANRANADEKNIRKSGKKKM